MKSMEEIAAQGNITEDLDAQYDKAIELLKEAKEN